MTNLPKIEVIQADITKITVDAIVNAANTSLMSGGGVDGAVHRAAGPELEVEARDNYDSCKQGNAVITGAYNLPAKFVIHAVGPRFMDGLRGEPEVLRSTYLAALVLADKHGVTSMAFPAISTGIYGFPKRPAAQIAASAVADYFKNHSDSTVDSIIFAAHTPEDLQILKVAMANLIGTPDPALKNRYLGALMGLAVGDTLGASVEFLPRDTYTVNEMPTTEIRGIQPGYFTDDTSMALCLADSLISCQDFDQIDQMQRYERWYDSGYLSPYNTPFGIGNTIHDAIRRFKNTGEPYSGLDHPTTAGNGSLMRLAPIPMLYRTDIDQAAYFARESSRTTHQAPEALEACEVYARMMVVALEGGDKAAILAATGAVDSLSDNIRRIVLGSYRNLERDDVLSTGYVIHSLEAALWAFYHTDNYRDGALLAVNLGNDTDTIAAIYGQLAGAHYGVEAIPEHWRKLIVMRDVVEGMAGELCELSEVS